MSVFANGLEVSGKATPNKTIAAMPDVCMSPPPPPAGPVPIPYPLTGMASDTTDGCTSVFVKGKEAGKKNASKYSKTTGDEPATNSFGAGVVTHKITGPLKFAAYSFDVIFEGGGAERFSDMTTQNHMNAGNASLGVSAAQAAAIVAGEDNLCQGLKKSNQSTRQSMRQNKSQAVQDAGRLDGNATVTTAQYTPPPGGGPPQVIRACSRALKTLFNSGFARGMSSKEKQKRRRKPPNAHQVNSNACGGHTYKSGFQRPHTSHTEARIIEDIFRSNPAGGGKLVLGIDWPGGPAAGATRQSPCSNCKDLICAAMECMEIKVCDETNQAKKPKCP